MNEIVASYIAGLFDGEGSAQFKTRIETKRKGKRYNCLICTLEVSMTDETTIRFIHDSLKEGTVRLNVKNKSPSSKPYWRDQWRWRCGYQQAYRVAKLLYPYSITKKDKLGEIIKYYDNKETNSKT